VLRLKTQPVKMKSERYRQQAIKKAAAQAELSGTTELGSCSGAMAAAAAAAPKGPAGALIGGHALALSSGVQLRLTLLLFDALISGEDELLQTPAPAQRLPRWDCDCSRTAGRPFCDRKRTSVLAGTVAATADAA
jgi:hypothetical protein